MGRRVRLGRIADVYVEIDWSWFVAFGLGAWTLATLAPTAAPDVPPGEIAVLAIVGTLCTLGSLAFHEIVRVVAARACGERVRRLTLLLFGGITNVEGDPSSPQVETIASVCALAASVGLGTLCLGGATLFRAEVERRAPGAIVPAWLAAANLGTFLVNLLPAYPLDGGRIARAILWRATGDLERSTRWVAWSAEALGWFAIVLGVPLVFAAHDIGMLGGMWTTIAGWYLASAAAQAYGDGFAREKTA